MLRLLCGLLATGSVVGQQFAQSSGRQPVEIPAGLWSCVALADCDGDGDQDVAGNLQSTQGQFVVMRQGAAKSWTTYNLLPNVVTAAKWADFDLDGDLDVLVGATNLSVGVPCGIVRNDGASFTWLGQSPSLLVGTTTRCLAADLDGDQLPEAVIGVSSGVQIARNLGSAALGLPTIVTTLPQARPALFDRDGDGDLDLVVASPNGVVLMNNTAGVFTQVAFVANGTDVAAGDFDGDGRIDLAFARGGTVDIRWNQLSGWVLAAGVVPQGATVQEVAVGDLDRDGDLDVVVRTETSVDWLRNAGGTFSREPGIQLGTPWQVRAMALGDGASRGAVDVVAVFHDGQVRTLYGAAPQPFLDPQAQGRMPVDPGAPSVGDVDGDGRPDLVLPRAREVVRNEGRGRFSRRPIVGARSNCHRACLADLDADGDLDLLLGTTTLPIPPVPPLQRLENDGFGNFTPVQDVPLPWHVQAYCPGDVDGDGDVDILVPGFSTVGLLENTGNGTLVWAGSLPSVPTATNVNNLVFADLDGDGDRDLVGGHIQGALPVCANNGFGTFAVSGSLQMLPGAFSWRVGAGDLDLDGDLDIVVLEGTALGWYRNLGAGGFPRVNGAFPAGNYGEFELGDIDEDGDIDMVVGGRLLVNDGAGMFQDASAQLPSFPSVPGYSLVDCDEDGDVDLFAAWHATSTGVLLQPVINRRRAAESVHFVQPGGSMQVRFFVNPQAPDPLALLLVVAALGPGPSIAIPGHLGSLLLPLGTLVPLTMFGIPSGTGTTGFPIPPVPTLIGIEVSVQGVVVASSGLAFTNVVDECILP
jgi:hypothetical protein